MDPWDEIASDDQRKAGLAHIAGTVADFRDVLLDRGFSRREAFKMSRDMLIELMCNTMPEETVE